MKIINYGREIVTYRVKGQKYEFLPKIPTLVDKRIVTLENLQNCYGTILCEYIEDKQENDEQENIEKETKKQTVEDTESKEIEKETKGPAEQKTPKKRGRTKRK